MKHFGKPLLPRWLCHLVYNDQFEGGTGGEGVTSLLDYALMTILDQLLTRQRFSLVNWITYKMESHAPHDFGFIQSIRRWWTRDEGAEWCSVFIAANSLMRRIGSDENWSRRLVEWRYVSLTWEQRLCVNTCTITWTIHYLIVLWSPEV